MKTKLTLVLVAALTSTAFAGFQAPLPEFKNEKQLAEWRAEKASEATSQGYAAEETAFYTGKPYLASSGGYAFKYRSYNPELARWTSEDPSGFPDGANNSLYVSNLALSALDPNGLAIIYDTAKTTGGGGSFAALDPARGFKFSYTLKDNIHFADMKGEFTSYTAGKWSDSTAAGSRTFAVGAVEVYDEGVESHVANQKQDWIKVQVTFTLTSVDIVNGHTITGYSTFVGWSDTIKGALYE
jgi:RHS repeat-associated protein